MIPRFFVVFCTIFFAFLSNSQTDTLNWKKFQSRISVTTIKGKNDYLLIGTTKGIVKYFPATNQTIFYTEENDGLPDNYITSIQETSKGQLWVSTYYHGVARKDSLGWKDYTVYNSSFPSEFAKDIFAKNDSLYVATLYGGIARYQGNNNWVIWNKFNSGLKAKSVRTINEDKDGALWFGTYYGGITRLKSGIWRTWQAPEIPELDSTVAVFDLEIADDNSKWIGTRKGIIHLQDSTYSIFNSSNSPLPYDYVYAICQDTNKTLWFGTEFGLASKTEDGNWDIFRTWNSPLISEYITSLYADENNKLWIGTYSDGLYSLENGVWNHIPLEPNYFMSDNDVRCILPDSSNTVFAGTTYGGVVEIKSDKEGSKSTILNQKNNLLISDYANAIERLKTGELCISSSFGGVSIIKNGISTFYSPRNCGLTSDYVVSMTQWNGELFVATADSGIYKFKNNIWTHFSNSIPGFIWNKLSFIKANNNEFLWVATSNGELIKISKNLSVDVFDHTNSPLSSTIKDIAFDKAGNLFLASFGSGAYYFDGINTWKNWKNDNSGLLSNSLVSVAVDTLGNKYFGSIGSGLFRLSEIGTQPTWKQFNTLNSPLLTDLISSLKVDSLNNIWIGTLAGGLYAYNSDTLRLFRKNNPKGPNVSSTEPDNKIAINCFPNPSHGLIFVESSDHFVLDKVSVYNEQGENVIHLKNIKSSQFSFDLSSFPAGIYFLVVQSESRLGFHKIFKE
jgi:ligand-binding sensor domain-containing protein